MKHFYSKLKCFLVALFALIGTGAWAIDVKIADTSSGLPQAAGFGSFSGQVFTTADGSGLAGVTVTAESGVTMGEATINGANYGNCFKLVTAAAATDYRITLAAPAGYFIRSYSLQCSANTSNAVHTLTSEDNAVSVVASAPPYNSPTGPKPFVVDGLNAQTTYFTISTANQGNTLYLPSFIIQVYPDGTKFVNVTYELYESDGTTKIESEVIEQLANSEISVPSSLTAGDFSAYDYATEGTIGEEDCTIKVIRTLKEGIVSDVATLSNTKSYYIYCDRGEISTTNGHLANTVKTTLELSKKSFAVLTKQDVTYLYCVEDAQFVGSDGTLGDTPAAITFKATTTPAYQIMFGNKYLNATSGVEYGAVIDSWSAVDDGNQYVFVEATDFDPTDALALIPFDLEKVIVNADFSSAEGWTPVVSSGSFRDYGVYQIGGEQNVRFAAPTADETHLDTEYAAGFEARWSNNYASYTQTIELPAGAYAITFDVENVNGATTEATYENRFTVTVGETVTTDESTEWMEGKSAWTTHAIVFDLTEAGNATLSFGYGTDSNNFNADNTPAIYVSHLKLMTLSDYVKPTLEAEIEVAEALETEDRTEGLDDFDVALSDAWTALESTDADVILAALEALKAAETAYLKANLPVAEGTYYVYHPATEQFLSRGANWGTRAVVDAYGVAINLAATDLAEGKYTLTGFDNNASYGDDVLYSDKTGDKVRNFSIAKVEGGYTMTNATTGVPVYVDADYIVDYNADVEAEAAVWQFVTAAERDAMVAAHESAERAAAFEAAGVNPDATMELGEATELT